MHIRFVVSLISCIVLLFSGATKLAWAEQTNKQGLLEAGAYNHLTLCFALLRKGIEAKVIRNDITGNIDLSSMSPALQEQYWALLHLTDQVIEHQTIAIVDSRKRKERAQVVRQQEADQLVSGLTVAALTGDPITLVATLASTVFGAKKSTVTAKAAFTTELIRQNSQLRRKISDLEFQLGLARGRLKKSTGLDDSAFISPADVDRYLEIKDGSRTVESLTRQLARLYARTPALYLASYDLALLSSGVKKNETRQYLENTIEHLPSPTL